MSTHAGIGEAKMSESLVITIETNAYLVRQLEAKQKRIDHLEFILEQRYRETKRQYDPEKFGEMKRKIYEGIFLNNPGIGFTYEEIATEFNRLYKFESEFLGPRLRELRKENKIWSDDSDGTKKVRFYLKVAEVERRL